MENSSSEDSFTVKMQVRYDDWRNFGSFCTQLGHGLPEEVCRMTVEDLLCSGTFDSLDHSPEEYTKRSATYWLLLRRLWVYQLAVIGTFGASFILMWLVPTDAGRIPLFPLYLVAGAGVVGLSAMIFSEAFEANRLGTGIPNLVRNVRLIELTWLLPLCLLAVSTLFTLGWLAYVTLLR